MADVNATEIITESIIGLQAILTAAGEQGKPIQVLTEITAALMKLLEVQNSPVTLEQLEGLRLKKQW